VERTVTRVRAGTLRPGLCAFVSSHLFDADPAATHGIEFTEVTVDGELGPLPAWQIPPAGQDHCSAAAGTWVVAVHGRGASRAEALRVLPTLATAGVSTLVVSYRNDREAPSSPDGLCHLGDTEWRDIESAVRYASRHGASRIVLYGWSMGAMTAVTALRRMSRDDGVLVRGIVLDSPVLDWAATLAWQATRRGVPPPLAQTTLRLVTRRAGLDLPGLDYAGFAAQLQVPVLLFVDLADRTAPPEPALRFGRARPDLVTLVTTDVGHGRSWNQDPPRYEAAIRDFLAHIG
jgi:dienelactone hydrolase